MVTRRKSMYAYIHICHHCVYFGSCDQHGPNQCLRSLSKPVPKCSQNRSKLYKQKKNKLTPSSHLGANVVHIGRVSHHVPNFQIWPPKPELGRWNQFSLFLIRILIKNLSGLRGPQFTNLASKTRPGQVEPIFINFS